MSGPKITVYNLTPEQAKLLRLQNICHKKFLAHRKWWKDYQDLLTEHLKESEELLRLTSNDSGFFQKKKEFEDVADQNLLQLKNGITENSITILEKVVEESKQKEKKLTSQRMSLVEIMHSNKILLTKQVAQRKNSLDGASSLNFNFSEERDGAIEEFQSLKEIYLLILDKYNGNDSFTPELQEKIKKSIGLLADMKDLSFLKNAITIQLKPLIIECEEYQIVLTNQKILQNEFQRIYVEYEALCEMLQLPPQMYTTTKENLILLEIEIILLEEKLESAHHQNYIHEAIQDVMEHMGYNLLGNREVTKKNGSQFRNELFDYADGTAVNITYASNGQISMELGGLSEDDRLPDHEQTSHLCQSMESFCGDFHLFEKKLAEKGVLLGQRISHFPSEPAYAQMINVNDYDLKEEARLLEAKQKKASIKNKKSKYVE